jgi:hypothetical protein
MHCLPGRVRLRNVVEIADPAVLRSAEAALLAIPGVSQVEPNGRTGSILVHFEPDPEMPARLVEALRALALDSVSGPVEVAGSEISRAAKRVLLFGLKAGATAALGEVAVLMPLGIAAVRIACRAGTSGPKERQAIVTEAAKEAAVDLVRGQLKRAVREVVEEEVGDSVIADVVGLLV